ncbi:alpha/beta hydrolase [Haloechinothrix sp. YIM 98757]|uniref:Alpha/beta hydrolase n=2 Tax=Haloechinothrix aidingensis TaxID=2752311 RepID=A0A837ZYL8_9PSEU|nr:alpha/beta hydrolase [Haloechinothrix aidingensis]
MPSSTAVLLPGTGSDDAFVRAAFERPLRLMGIRLLAPFPTPGAGIVENAFAALDRAAERSSAPLVVGGVSFGAHIAAAWSLRNPRRCAGLLIALPAWSGEPDGAPAARAAHLSARWVREDGLDSALTQATRDVRPWLARELHRTWRRHGADLADGLDAAARHPAPELAELRALDVPAGIATCTDDAVHPTSVAEDWARALPAADVRRSTLDALEHGRDPLGRAALLALLRAVSRR